MGTPSRPGLKLGDSIVIVASYLSLPRHPAAAVPRGAGSTTRALSGDYHSRGGAGTEFAQSEHSTALRGLYQGLLSGFEHECASPLRPFFSVFSQRSAAATCSVTKAF